MSEVGDKRERLAPASSASAMALIATSGSRRIYFGEILRAIAFDFRPCAPNWAFQFVAHHYSSKRPFEASGGETKRSVAGRFRSGVEPCRLLQIGGGARSVAYALVSEGAVPIGQSGLRIEAYRLGIIGERTIELPLGEK